MKRVVYEWGGIACTALATLTLAYWIVPQFTDRTDFGLNFDNSAQLRGADGQFAFSDALGNGQDIDNWDLSTFEPAVLSDINATLCGYGYRHVTFADGSTAWYSRVPPLILFMLLGTLCTACFRQVRKLRQMEYQEASAQETTATP